MCGCPTSLWSILSSRSLRYTLFFGSAFGLSPAAKDHFWPPTLAITNIEACLWLSLENLVAPLATQISLPPPSRPQLAQCLLLVSQPPSLSLTTFHFSASCNLQPLDAGVCCRRSLSGFVSPQTAMLPVGLGSSNKNPVPWSCVRAEHHIVDHFAGSRRESFSRAHERPSKD